jgi:hypothetical protein
MPTITNAERQLAYRQRRATAGKTTVQLTVSQNAADRLRTLAAERDEPTGRVLEHVLDVASSAPLSARKHARLERRVDEAIAVILAGERHIGNPDARARRRTARQLGAAR